MAAHNDLERNRTKVQPERMSAGTYFATRFSTLKPPMHKVSYRNSFEVLEIDIFLQLPNPIKLLRLLNGQQWLFFLVGFLGCAYSALSVFRSC